MMNIPPYSNGNGASGGNDSLYTEKMASGITKTGKLFTDVDSFFNSNEDYEEDQEDEGDTVWEGPTDGFKIKYIKTILGSPENGLFQHYNILKTPYNDNWDFNPQQFGAGKSGAYIIRINVLHTKIFWSNLFKEFDKEGKGILDQKIKHYLDKINEHNEEDTKPTNYILKFYPTSFLYNIKNKEDKIKNLRKNIVD